MNNEDQGPSETAKTSEKNTKEPKEDNLKHLHKNGRHYVHCETCFSNPNVVKIFSRKAKLPAIAQEPGTIYRKSVGNEQRNSSRSKKDKEIVVFERTGKASYDVIDTNWKGIIDRRCTIGCKSC